MLNIIDNEPFIHKTMKITEDILRALRKAVEACESQRTFASRAGVHEGCISKYFKGKIKKIEHENWLKLEPLLRPYMNTEQRVAVFHPGAEGKGKEPQTAAEGIENDPNLTPREKKAMLLHLKEIELDRKFGITDDESEGHNPTSGAVAG